MINYIKSIIVLGSSLRYFLSIDDEHSLKVAPPIEVTEEGIVICVNDEHPEKA